jgi:hypothetical protein
MQKRLILVLVGMLGASPVVAETVQPQVPRPKPAAKAKPEPAPAPVDPYAKARKVQEEYFKQQADKTEAEKAKAKKEEGERWLRPKGESALEKSGFRFTPFGAGNSGSGIGPGR